MTLAQARADIDAATSRHLVQIKGEAAVQHAEMHRVVRLGRQLFQPGASDARQMHLLTGGVTQFQQFRPQAVALARAERQQAPLHQGRGQTMGGAARQVQPLGQFGQRQGALHQRINHVQTTQQGLAAGRLGADFFFPIDLCGLD
ncbi:hypothetical protein D3C80_1450050 [compost metagenome]